MDPDLRLLVYLSHFGQAPCSAVAKLEVTISTAMQEESQQAPRYAQAVVEVACTISLSAPQLEGLL